MDVREAAGLHVDVLANKLITVFGFALDEETTLMWICSSFHDLPPTP